MLALVSIYVGLGWPMLDARWPLSAYAGPGPKMCQDAFQMEPVRAKMGPRSAKKSQYGPNSAKMGSRSTKMRPMSAKMLA